MIREALPSIARRCGVESPATPTGVESITTENPRAYQHYVAGLLASEEYSRQDDAVREFMTAVTQDSNFASAHMELGRMYWGVGGYQDRARARVSYEKAWSLRSHLGMKDQMRLRALREDAENRAGEAIMTLRKMHERWPDDRQALRDLGNQLFWRWYFSEMLVVHEEGQLLYPDDVVIGGLIYSNSLVALGRTGDALRATRSYLKRHPGEPNSWDGLGLRYLALGFPDSAEGAYRKAMELDPSWSPENLSYCAYHRGDLKAAIAGFETMLAQRNLSADRRRYLVLANQFNVHLAALYFEAGRFKEVHALCRNYMEPADHLVGQLFLHMGEMNAVLALSDRLDEQSDGVPARQAGMRGKALAATGDLQGARAVAKKVLESEFEWGGRARYEALQIEAEVALAEHNADTALDILTTIKQNGVPFGGLLDIRYRSSVARAYRMAGRLQEAADVHKEMLRVYGGHALSHYELGQIYEEMKRRADAKKEYEKFLEMWSEADEGLPQLVHARKRFAAL
jgi:tetratricopeptide (TPR) repeat protein